MHGLEPFIKTPRLAIMARRLAAANTRQRNSSAGLLHSEQFGTWQNCPILSCNAVKNIVVRRAISYILYPNTGHATTRRHIIPSTALHTNNGAAVFNVPP